MKILDVAGVLITLALVENIQATIPPGLVKFFSGEIPLEVGSLHSIETSSIWVVLIRSRFVAAASNTSPPAASPSASATSSIGVKFGDPEINLVLAPSS